MLIFTVLWKQNESMLFLSQLSYQSLLQLQICPPSLMFAAFSFILTVSFLSLGGCGFVLLTLLLHIKLAGCSLSGTPLADRRSPQCSK